MTQEAVPRMTPINRWYLSCQNQFAPAYQFVELFYDEPSAPCAAASVSGNYFTVQNLENGQIALQFLDGAANPLATVDYDNYRLQFQDANGNWNVYGTPFQPIPTGDGYFVLYARGLGKYLTISPSPDPGLLNCYPLHAGTSDIRMAARLTAAGLNRNSVFDFLEVGKTAAGLSFAGVNLANVNLSGGNDLSGCDFRRVKNGSLSGCILDDAKLQYASFAGLHLDGLSISTADCTHADFSGCDFTSFTPGTPPPVLADADLSGAAIPGGNTWSGANMPGAVLAEATLTGCDLSGAATNLAGANLSGAGVTVFEPTYQGSGGIGGYNLGDGADQVIAFDYDSTPGQPKLNYLVCYRPGAGAVAIVQKKNDGTFGNVYFQGAGGNGIGGYPMGDPADRVIAYDYEGTGHLDHLVCYRPGSHIISIIEKKTDSSNNVTFDEVWNSESGIGGSGGCDLGDARDRIIAYDYEGTGRLDHLACYRPGTGSVWILEKDTDQAGQVTFTAVFTSTGGIGGYKLDSDADQVIAFDYDSTPGQPKLNYLVCYRPGRGAVAIAQKKTDPAGNVTFGNVYFQGDLGNGIGGYDLLNPADRIVAFDYEGNGHLDHLVCYRPGSGTIWILQKDTDQTGNVAFAPVYRRFGIGGYDLADPRDQVIAYDYAGAGHLDDLVCYRPGTGTIWILQSRPARPATLKPDTGGRPCNLTNANLSAAHFEGLDLSTTPSLTGANLSGTQLPGAKLAGVNLAGATLVGTNFTGTDLTEVTFSFPLIRSADPRNPTIFTGCTLPYAAIGLDWTCLDLTSATITGLPNDLTGLVAVGVRRPRGDFTGLILDGANFANATLDGALFTDAKLRATKQNNPGFAGASLTGAYFTHAVLDQADFTGVTLAGTKSTRAADFSSAWISNCEFTEANCYGVIFAGATLISGNTLNGATSLQESDFSDAYLPYADFTGAMLQGAKFDGACMVSCVLAGAELTPAQEGAIPASLTSACLQAADFTGTHLGGASLTDAAITDTTGAIQVSHYDQYGNLIGPEPISWQNSRFPSDSSFTAATVCPNGSTYGSNQQRHLSDAQMMQAQNPPTKWAPTNRLR
jgi:uncharacterized protein YjbI with pentapeptide repeats